MNESRLLLEVRPSWWHFFWHFVFFWLIIPLIVAIWRRKSLILRLYEDRILIEEGILSKNYIEVFIKDIRSVNVYKSLTQRIFNIGNLMIATAGTIGYELSAAGLPDPIYIKDIIIEQRNKYS